MKILSSHQLERWITRLFKFRKYPIFGHLLRFFGWWFAFAGIYSMAAVCPCCGQARCPVGASRAGVLGGFMALCMQNWKKWIHMRPSKGKRRIRHQYKNETTP